MSEAALSLKDVSRYFDMGRVRGVDALNLEIPQGQSVAILGPSGSGKSTLLNLMGTLDFCTKGELRIFGRIIREKDNLDDLRASRIGFIFQLHNLIPNLTLLENVMLPMKTRPNAKLEKLQRAKTLLEQVGLKDRMDFMPVKVSGGERQRCAIARALANNPNILLGDEPTGNLDSETGGKIIDLLLNIANQDARTLVIVTHNPELAARMHRRLRIVDGNIVEDVLQKS